MTETSLTIKTPGKLMIAGEFAVLVPKQRIVVMAVNRFVYTTIEESTENTLSLENFKLQYLKWDHTENGVFVHSENKQKDYVENAMTIAMTYLKENGVSVKPCHLSVHSELDDISGVKYGLGSSAAVVTSVITAILNMFLHTEPSKTLIFKLASMTHVKTQGNGSGADIAASTYGGVLAYTSFQAEWLNDAMNVAESITELVNKDWIYWSVEPIQLPDALQLSIGWTGKPASTSHLVRDILSLQASDSCKFEAFLENSDRAVNMFLHGVKTNNISELIAGVKKNRQALMEVGDQAIETPLLRTLCDLAEQYGGAGKPSGAGGGDCGIAFLPPGANIEGLNRLWVQNGIKPLSLNTSPAGSTVSCR